MLPPALPHSLIIRCEDSENTEARSVVRSINEAAFGGPQEAELVDTLALVQTQS